MHDAALVSRIECFDDLHGERQGFGERDARARAPTGITARRNRGCDPVVQRHAGDQFHHQRMDTVVLLEAVDRGNVGMIQRRQGTRLALKARQPLLVGLNGGRQDLQRDVATEFRVVRPVDLAHSADTEDAGDPIRAEPRASRQRHVGACTRATWRPPALE